MDWCYDLMLMMPIYNTISDSQAEVTTLEQELKRSSEVVLDLERRLRLMEEEKGAFEKA